MPSETREDPLCTVHRKPAQWSYCGGYWFCEGGYEEEMGGGYASCAVADEDEELGGEG